MATKEEILKKLGAPASKADILKKLGAPDGKPPEPSPYDSVSGTMTQIGKILGSGLEQAATGIAGMPAQTADMYNAGLDMLPEGARPYVEGAARILNPTLALSQGLRAMGAPTGPEMDQYLRDKGLQYAPEPGSGEDWAQYLTSVAASGAVPIGQPATIANALRGATASVIPAAASKAVADSTESPTAGMVASLIASLGQHGVGKTVKAARPSNSVGKALANDVDVPTLEEYRRLGVPAIAADVIDPGSGSAAALTKAVQRYPEKAKGLVSALTNREAGSGMRAQQYVEDAISPGSTPPTRAQLEANLEAARKAEADLQFPTVREGQTPVDIRSFGSKLRAATRGQTTDVPTEMENLQKKYFSKLAKTEQVGGSKGGPPGTKITYTQDPSKIYSVIREMEADAKKNPHLADDIGNLKRELDGTLEAAYPQYAGIKEDFRKASEEIEALDIGAKAAQKGRVEDVRSSFSELGARPKDPNYTPDPAHKAKLEQAFRLGYGDTMIQKIQNVTPGADVTKPISSVGISRELPSVLDADTAAKLDFESRAKQTGKQYTPTAAEPRGIIETIKNTPGYGFSAITSLAGLGGGALTGSLPIALAGGVAGGVGLANLLRNPQLAKTWLKAAQIEDPAELQKLINKAVASKYTLGSNAKAATRAGLVNMITGGQ